MSSPNGNKTFIIGSRGSQLALWQSNHVAGVIHGGAEITVIKTAGDRFLDRALQGQADKGFFTKEIEDELLAGNVDLAVHSLKDLPTELPEGLELGAVSKRAAVADVLLVHPASFDEQQPLPVKPGGVVGATSLRRQSLLRRFAPHLKAAMLRGNVPTRVDKLRNGEYDAIILARAGLDRLQLDLQGLHVYELNPSIWIPAPGQAVMGVELRLGDERVKQALCDFHDDAAWQAVMAERELLARFEGGCHAAFGAWAQKLDKGGFCIRLGHEDEHGNWRAAYVENSTMEEATARAYEELERVLKGGEETAIMEGSLCQPLS